MDNLESGTDAILITGPTASGKSALAVALARAHGGEVINADSMQVYDGLHVLTARPDEQDMQGVPHHLYGHVPAGEAHSTAAWLKSAAATVDAVRGRGRLPVFVGGTGLYFRALAGGLSDMPAVPNVIRETYRQRLLAEGPGPLHAELALRDPAAGAQLRPTDGQRVVRALEILETTGVSILQFQARRGPMVIDPDRALKIVLLPERSVLRARIDRRFAQMLDQGAIEEVEALLALNLSPELPVMKAIGVPQIARLIAGTSDRETAIETGAAATRQYAKRQMTWFRNQLDESWQITVPA